MISSMSDEFLEWLNECPAQWFLNSDDGDGSAEYSFHEETKDNEDKEV